VSYALITLRIWIVAYCSPKVIVIVVGLNYFEL